MSETTSTAKTVTTRRCTCGCGEATSSSKTMYKPGHDARHAGQVARLVVEKHLVGDAAQAELAKLPTANLQYKAGQMVTRLLAKLEAAAVKELAKKDKAAAKAPKAKKSEKAAGEAADKKAVATLVAQEEERHAAEEAAKRAEAEAAIQAEDFVYEEGFSAKVGRWEYPGRRYLDESGEYFYERNSKRDGSGEWLAADYSAFK